MHKSRYHKSVEFLNYDSWAKEQLTNSYSEREKILLWKAEHIANIVPDNLHFSSA